MPYFNGYAKTSFIHNKKKTQNVSKNISAVKALWKAKENTACITFYFDGEPTEDELEDASIACTEIIAHCSNGLLEENYIRWDYPKLLPDEQFLAYKREEKN